MAFATMVSKELVRISLNKTVLHFFYLTDTANMTSLQISIPRMLAIVSPFLLPHSKEPLENKSMLLKRNNKVNSEFELHDRLKKKVYLT